MAHVPEEKREKKQGKKEEKKEEQETKHNQLKHLLTQLLRGHRISDRILTENLAQLGQLSNEQLRSLGPLSGDEFLRLCEMRCMIHDKLLERGQALGHRFGDAGTVPREAPRDLLPLRGWDFVWGLREPFHSRHILQETKLLRLRLRYLYHVLQVQRLILLEAKGFEIESDTWEDITHGTAMPAKLIAIRDWTLPTVEHLLDFATEVFVAKQLGHTLACHCIAGAGRTGILFLFLLAISSSSSPDLVTLLIGLAKKYAPKAAIEIITTLSRHEFTVRQLMQLLHDAAESLAKNTSLIGDFKIHVPEVHGHFSLLQQQRLARHGLRPRN